MEETLDEFTSIHVSLKHKRVVQRGVSRGEFKLAGTLACRQLIFRARLGKPRHVAC